MESSKTTQFRYDTIKDICIVERTTSIGEKKIMEILDKYNLVFTREVSMKGCKYKNKLKFDFRINAMNKFFLIEYDGNQHFEASIKTGGVESLNITKEKDCIKRRWCDANKIKLFRIRFNQFDEIENLIVQMFEQYNDIMYYFKVHCSHCGFISDHINIYIKPKPKTCEGCKQCFQ